MIPEDRLQQIINGKDSEESLRWCEEHGYVEGWAICDGALVIYDVENPPSWFRFERDEDGNSLLPERA